MCYMMGKSLLTKTIIGKQWNVTIEKDTEKKSIGTYIYYSKDRNMT